MFTKQFIRLLLVLFFPSYEPYIRVLHEAKRAGHLHSRHWVKAYLAMCHRTASGLALLLTLLVGAAQFSVLDAQTITSIAPSSGTLAGGTR